MSWLVHAVENDDGAWVCRHGLREIDSHAALSEALRHLREVGAQLGPGTLTVVHHLNGTVEQFGPAEA